MSDYLSHMWVVVDKESDHEVACQPIKITDIVNFQLLGLVQIQGVNLMLKLYLAP